MPRVPAQHHDGGALLHVPGEPSRLDLAEESDAGKKVTPESGDEDDDDDDNEFDLEVCPGLPLRTPSQPRRPALEVLLRRHQEDTLRQMALLLGRQEQTVRSLLEQYLNKMKRRSDTEVVEPGIGCSWWTVPTTQQASPRTSSFQPSAQRSTTYPPTCMASKDVVLYKSETEGSRGDKISVLNRAPSGVFAEASRKYVDITESEQVERQDAIRDSLDHQQMLRCPSTVQEHMGQLPSKKACTDEPERAATRQERFKKMVDSVYFELFFAVMILTNSVFIGIEVGYFAEHPSTATPTVFYVSQFVYAAIFLVELLMRLGSGGCRHFLCHSQHWLWNWFDSFVVLCSLVDVSFWLVILTGSHVQSQSTTGSFSILRMARMARLFRVLRIGRIMRFIKSLRLLVISILSSLKALFWAMVLLLIIIYVFGILLAQATADFLSTKIFAEPIDEPEGLREYWGTLPTSMYTLYMSIAGGLSWKEAVMPLAEVSGFWGAVFTCFITFAYFAVLNVMTGVFCQTAFENMQKQQDLIFHDMLSNKSFHVDNINKLFDKMDDDRSGELCFAELHKCWEDESMQKFFASLDLTPDDCWMMFKLLDSDNKHSVTAEEFVEGCMRLRGQAKAFDMAVMRYEQRWQGKQLTEFMNRMEAGMDMLTGGHLPEQSSDTRNFDPMNPWNNTYAKPRGASAFSLAVEASMPEDPGRR